MKWLNLIQCAALQLYDYGLFAIPLKGKVPLISKWSTRFNDHPLERKEIIKGINNQGKFTFYKGGENIGILTGRVSGVIVLDIDDIDLMEKLEDVPQTWTVKTSRGLHFYFRYQEGIPSIKYMPGIDILSDKKIAVAPPSIHPSGHKYRWILSPRETEIKEVPAWLISQIKKLKPNNSSTLYKKIHHNNSENNWLDMLNNDWFEFYSRHLENIKGNEKWLNARCPFHHDHHNSFSFNKENGGWVCFAGCGKGNGIQFIRKLYNIPFLDALDLLRGRNIYV